MADISNRNVQNQINNVSKESVQAASSKKNICDKSREWDPSGALGDTNENREIESDNFFNEENAKDAQDKIERKKMYAKMLRYKKVRSRVIEANNKLAAKKIKNRISKQATKPPTR